MENKFTNIVKVSCIILFFFLFQILATILVFEYFLPISSGQCVHPPDANHQKLRLKNEIFRNYVLGHWTYNVIDEYRKVVRLNFPRNLIDVTTRQSKIHGKRSCKRNRKLTPDSDIEEQSTCPWYVVMDVDAQREPQAIAKAKCSCKRCFTLDRTGNTRDKCTHVNSFIPVIKWRCLNDVSGQSSETYFQYFIDIETVPVGCTCKRPGQIEN